MEEIENVRVVVRVRPLSEQEIISRCLKVVQEDEENHMINVIKPNCAEPPKSFVLDHVFGQLSTQLDIYRYTASPIVEKVLEGYNGTVLAYGQTGTGKTYTMAGIAGSRDHKGIIPNTFAHIFSNISKAHENVSFLVRVTYMEIYNEEVRDLLVKPGAGNLEVREHADIGVFVKDLSGYVVNSVEDMESIMAVGDKNRVVGATNMNIHSSRSHAIFTITVESSEEKGENRQRVKVGKLHLVDLAGSERQSKTHATGLRLKEATKINQSLSVLGHVISALVDLKTSYIPYRNSKLTRLLQDSLGGNSKTVMIAAISPADRDFEETVSTLRYATRAKFIKNCTRINKEPKDGLLKQFQDEIEELRKQLETMNTDNIDEMMEEPKMMNGDILDEKKERRKKQSKTKIVSEDDDEEEDVESIKQELSGIHDEELNRTKSEQAKLEEKLQNLQNKILVGGENLLEKAQTQEFILEMSAAELENIKRTEAELEQSLQEKDAEKLDIGERYSSLQEEAVGKSKKLKKVINMLMATKAELNDQLQEQQREMEGILDCVRALTREVQLAELLLNIYVPKKYQALIERNVTWDENIGEWQLRCVAYTGNNVSRTHRNGLQDTSGRSSRELEKSIYQQYAGRKIRARSRISNVPRPTKHSS